jgi:hypothetical protein
MEKTMRKIEVDGNSELGKQMEEKTLCTVSVPGITEEKKFKNFVVIGIDSNDNTTKVEVLTFCTKEELIKAFLAFQDVMVESTEEGTITPLDVLRAKLQRREL